MSRCGSCCGKCMTGDNGGYSVGYYMGDMACNMSLLSQRCSVECFRPGSERVGGGDEVEDSDHGRLTQIGSRT